MSLYRGSEGLGLQDDHHEYCEITKVEERTLTAVAFFFHTTRPTMITLIAVNIMQKCKREKKGSRRSNGINSERPWKARL